MMPEQNLAQAYFAFDFDLFVHSLLLGIISCAILLLVVVGLVDCAGPWLRLCVNQKWLNFDDFIVEISALENLKGGLELMVRR